MYVFMYVCTIVQEKNFISNEKNAVESNLVKQINSYEQLKHDLNQIINQLANREAQLEEALVGIKEKDSIISSMEEEALVDLTRWQQEQNDWKVELDYLRSLLEERDAQEIEMSQIYSEENSSTGTKTYLCHYNHQYH